MPAINRPEISLAALPRYAELRRGEVVHTGDHLTHGVPDRRLATLPAQYDELLRNELPLPPDEIRELRGFARRVGELWTASGPWRHPARAERDTATLPSRYSV